MQRLRGLVSDTSNTTLTIITVGFMLMLIIVMPQVIPGGRFGVACSALANPVPGGNNQSILAARSAEAMELSLALQRTELAVGEALVVNTTFINTGVGAITLFLVPAESLLRDDGTAGLNFEITRLSDRAVLSESTTVRPPNPQRTTFPVEILHILGGKQRCTEQITFDTIRLNSLGLTPGEYSIRAVYRNQYAGQLTNTSAIATPIFPTQGVYITRELRSDEVRFTIGLQTAPNSGEAQPLGG